MAKLIRSRRKSGSSPFLTGLLILALITVLSFGAAALWQRAESSSDTPPPPDTPEGSSLPVSASSSGPKPSPEPPAASSAPVSSVFSPASSVSSIPESKPEPSSAAESPGPQYAVRPGYEYALPETAEKVDKSYFDDALFFGDSLSVGIPAYHIMDNAAVIAFQGINTANINTKAAIDAKGDGNRVTMLEAAKLLYPDRKKIYIMLGGNGLNFEPQDFIDGYRTFVTSVRGAYPDAAILIQSMTPVTDTAHKTYPSVSNEKINQYNLEILALAKELGVHFVDVAAALMDESGKLPTEASPADGMHLNAEYYNKWFDYLRLHTPQSGGQTIRQ